MRSKKRILMKTAAGTLAGLIVLSGVGQISGNVKGAEKPEEAIYHGTSDIKYSDNNTVGKDAGFR